MDRFEPEKVSVLPVVDARLDDDARSLARAGPARPQVGIHDRPRGGHAAPAERHQQEPRRGADPRAPAASPSRRAGT